MKAMHDFLSDERFIGIKPFKKRVLLSSPTMHKTAYGKSWTEFDYIREAFETNWITCAGSNLTALEPQIADYLGAEHIVGLSCGTAAIHLAVKLAAEKLYGSSTGVSTPDGEISGGCLYGRKVFCTDMTFDASVNPIVYEGGEPVFIDSEYETWNMSPVALENAFRKFPDVKLVVCAHLYGTPARIDELKNICERHGALLIEDAAESLGSTYKGKQTGTWGDYGVISFNGNKIITGSAGGAIICHSPEDADKARKWSTQSRDPAPWYQHTELGYNYRMSNIIAGIIRGQMEYLGEHISAKKAIYNRYREGFIGLPVEMNPTGGGDSDTNCWLSCMIIDPDSMESHARSDHEATYSIESGKSSPSEILDAMNAFNAEGRPIWKPMHMQPIYLRNAYVTVEDNVSISEDIFQRGLCLPSDNKMTEDEQNKVIEIIRKCFD